MEFQKQYAIELEEIKNDHPVMADTSEIKQQVNDVLFRYMPPRTTIAELDALAMAVFNVICQAWSEAK